MSPKKILIDTDNTLGQQFRWNDDGLAILYSFGKRKFDIIGITTVFGNSSGKKALQNTEKVLRAIRKEQVPLKNGANAKGDTNTDASPFLAEIAASNPGKITLLALGPLTNLQGAYGRDPDFFKNLKKIILMGGITKERLQVGRIKMKDVNLKADLNAALTVLNAECPITVINCHICKQVPLEKAHLMKLKFLPEGIIEELKEEFWLNSKIEQVDHIFIWDVLVPVFLSNPQIFEENKIQVKAKTISDIKDGRLQQVNQNGVEINMPETISDKERFYQEIFETWKSLHERVLNKEGTYREFIHSKIKQTIYKGFFSLLIPIALRIMYKKKGNNFYEE